MVKLWDVVEILAPHPVLAVKQMTALTTDEIFEMVKQDTLALKQTRHFLALWERGERAPYEKDALSRLLFLHSKLFWYNDMQEKKGLNLMEVALKISDRSPHIEREIASFLASLYTQAENSNMIRRLTLIHGAMERLAINNQQLLSKTTLGNHLADAEYLFKTRNYLAAKTQSLWVLRLDPQNEGARRVAGLSTFHLGEYEKALCHLKSLQNPDEDASNALMLSQLFVNQESKTHLCQIDNVETFDETD